MKAYTPRGVKFQQRYEKRHGNYAAGRVSVSRSLFRRELVRPILYAGDLRCSKVAHSNLKSCGLRFDNERIPVHGFEYDFSDDKLWDSVGIKAPKIGCLKWCR
jgi:hypothetical protein